MFASSHLLSLFCNALEQRADVILLDGCRADLVNGCFRHVDDECRPEPMDVFDAGALYYEWFER